MPIRCRVTFVSHEAACSLTLKVNMRENTQAAIRIRGPRILAGNPVAAVDAGRIQALQQYEIALRLMQERKYDKAKIALEKILSAGPGDLCERVRVYLAACAQQLNKTQSDFLNLEERYDYAISLLNTGDYDDARQQLEAILSQDIDCDFAYYGLALLASMTGHADPCLQHLYHAVRLNPRNRIQARADSDFQDMADDPRFTELLYPEFT